MSDKIYSRPRLKLYKILHFRKMNPFEIFLIIFFFITLVFIFAFLKFAYPIFKASCETAASSRGVKIINEEITNVMEEYSYNDIINIEKDVTGKITYIETNSFCLNEIVSKIISNIQNKFDNMQTVNVFINMGSVTGIALIKNLGPSFEIELESAGTIASKVRTKFESVGINQTNHKIYLEITSNIGIMTPYACFGKEINEEVLLTEAIIIGEVPQNYYNLDESSKELYTLKR